jgi:peptidoglycan hydrolase CwlO-like protein
MNTIETNLNVALAKIDQLMREIDLLREQVQIKESSLWSLKQEIAALKAVMGRMQVDREFTV